ncbi:MAG: porin family protein [bacterium]
MRVILTIVIKKIIVCMTLISACYNLFAQETTDNKTRIVKNIDFSLYCGFSFTNFQGETSEFAKTVNNSTGLNLKEKLRSLLIPVGLSASLNATPWLSFKSGVLFAPKGMKFKDQIEIDWDEYGIEVILKLYYIEIPTLIEFSTITNRNTHFYINGGISPSYKVNSKIVTTVWIIDYTPSVEDEETEKKSWPDVNKFDLGYIIGGGIKDQDIYLGIQYEKGLKNISTAGWDFKNQTFTILMGVYF